MTALTTTSTCSASVLFLSVLPEYQGYWICKHWLPISCRARSPAYSLGRVDGRPLNTLGHESPGPGDVAGMHVPAESALADLLMPWLL